MINIKLASPTSSTSKFISGLYKGLINNYVNANIWDMSVKPAFDLFFEEKFDVLFIEEENLRNNRALIKCLNNHENLTLIIKLPDNDLPDLELPLNLSNRIISVTTNEKCGNSDNKDLTQLVRYATDPDFYFINNRNNIRKGMVYIGEPSKYINSILSELCNPIGKIDIRLFTPPNYSGEPFPFSQYCGQLKSFDEERAIYNSAEFGLDIAEPNQNFINPEVYEILECGAEVITNNPLVKNVVNLESKKKIINYCYNDRAKQILDLF